MKRRQFIAAAGIGATGMLAGATSALGADKPPAEQRLQIYKCHKCDTMIEILTPGTPPLGHCGEPMRLLAEKFKDVGREKHVPVIEKTNAGYKVKVGDVPHPMTEAHLIEMIELIADGKVYRQWLTADDAPEAMFCLDAKEVSARAYCNVHGLWKQA